MLWFGARLVVENKLSPGELSTFVIYAVYVGSNVGQLAGVVSSLVQVYHHALTLCPALPRPCHALPKAIAYPVSAPAHWLVDIYAAEWGVVCGKAQKYRMLRRITALMLSPACST